MEISPTVRFINDWHSRPLPVETDDRLRLLLMDLIHSLVAGRDTVATTTMRRFVRTALPGQDATLWPSRERASLLGAVLANATEANAMDFDDGYRLVKGHPGAVVIPVVLALSETVPVSLEELLKAILIGYEVGLRVGRVLHAEYRDYHCSGSWGAIAAASAASYLLGLTDEEIDMAMGIAEYHAPVGLMMRCIDSPAMVKDGIGWGALAGVSATLMARQGFTGMYHLLHPVARLSQQGQEARAQLPPWDQFLLQDVYLKPYACCRWAHPAVAGVLGIRQQLMEWQRETVKKITVNTFYEATTLDHPAPTNTEQAQYSLPWSVASAWRHGFVGVQEVSGSALHDADTRAVAAKVATVRAPAFDDVFPSRTQAQVTVELSDGQLWESGIVEPPGERHTTPVGWSEVQEKFHHTLGDGATGAIQTISEAVRLTAGDESVHRLWTAMELLAD